MTWTILPILPSRAAAIGVERYVLDDGWFGARRNDHAGLGDWTVSPEVWPHGLHPLVDKVTGLGMEFGLWFEPEMINLDSAIARTHPEWIMSTGDRLPVESRHQQVINLGIPECYAYIRDAIFDILAEYKISYIKWDHNRDLIDAGTAPDGRPGVHEQTLAFYRLVDEIKAAHPGLEIETCSSGGARVDLGVLERTDRHLGQRLHRSTGAAADEPLDRSAAAAGAAGLAYCVGALPHHRPGARSVFPRRHSDLRSPRNRMGPDDCDRPKSWRNSRNGSVSTRQTGGC